MDHLYPSHPVHGALARETPPTSASETVQWGTGARPVVSSEHHKIYQQDVQVMVMILILK